MAQLLTSREEFNNCPRSGEQDYLHLIVVTSPQIDHDMFVAAVVGGFSSKQSYTAGHEPIEEHHGARVIQLIHLHTLRWGITTISTPQARLKKTTHLVEIRYFRDVAQVNDGKVLYLFGDGVERLVHDHALRVPVVPEADDDYAVLFGFDRLVDVPARGEVRQEIGHPRYCARSCVR
jgi:hypothetical protein